MRRYGVGESLTVGRQHEVARAALTAFFAPLGGSFLRRLSLAACLTLCPAAHAQSIFTIAGGGTDDGRPATVAGINQPLGVTVDDTGNLFIADTYDNRIRKVSEGSGIISTVAGSGADGFAGDGGPATAARLNYPGDVAVDTPGNLYISDTRNNRVRRVDARSGFISTIAGTGVEGFSGDGGPATAAALKRPTSVVIDREGNLYIADNNNERIRRISEQTGIISTIAGTGASGFSGDGGPAASASFRSPSDLFLDDFGRLFIVDHFNSRIRKLDLTSGVLSTVAGNGSSSFSGDGGLATGAGLDPTGVAVDGSGNIYISTSDGSNLTENNNRVRKVDAGTAIITTVAGNGSKQYSGDGGPATQAGIPAPADVAVDSAGNVYVASASVDLFYIAGGNRIRKVTAGSAIISTVAGNAGWFTGDGGPATAATIGRQDSRFPDSTRVNIGVAVDALGNILVADESNQRIRIVAAHTGVISTIAGIGRQGFSGDGGPGTAATLSNPRSVAVGLNGDIYIADSGNHRVRRVDRASGIIATVAGNGGYPSSSGDGGPATLAQLSPEGLALDEAGNLYIADTDALYGRVRKVDVLSGTISTVAGGGYGGDGVAATSSKLTFPRAVAFDRAGNLYIADLADRIRKVDRVTGIISTIAGIGVPGFSGDGGPATQARIDSPSGVIVDLAGNVYIAERSGNRIRKIAADSAIISTVAGDGSYAFAGDGGPASLSALRSPSAVALDTVGALYIADSGNGRIRVVNACVAIQTPSLISPSHASSGVATSPRLAWEPVEGAFRYDVYLGANPSTPMLALADLAATSFSPSNLEPLTTYYWKVVAKGDPFCDPFRTSASEVRSFTTASGCRSPAGFEGASP